LWDKIGIMLSGLCAVHCLAVSLVVIVLPFLSARDFLHDWTHLILLALIVPTVIVVARNGISRLILLLLIGGLIIITAPLVFHDHVSLWMESAITTAGSTLLIVGHWLHYRRHSKKACRTVRESNISVF
jgi:hypothetical protein